MSVEDFKTRFNAVYRPNQFKVTMNLPSTIPSDGAAERSEFFVRAAEIPGSSVGIVSVPFRGRIVKYAGDRVFAPWTVTVMNDDGFIIRKAIERWMQALDGHSDGCASADGITPALYQTTMEVQQLKKTCTVVDGPGTAADLGSLSWKFVNAFPVELSPIQLDYQSNDIIEEYTITFEYDYWTTAHSSQTTR